jgi:hypothetical protein
MPMNPKTGKTDRHAKTQAHLLEFRKRQAEQAEEPHTEAVKKGKRHTCDSPDAGGPEGSGLASSPNSTLAGLEKLALDSSGSSAGNTPADSPATIPQPPLPERPATAHPRPQAPELARALKVQEVSPLPSPLLQLPQVSWLRCQAPHICSSLGIGRPRILTATHHQRAMMEAILPRLLCWRGGRMRWKNGCMTLISG